jgi:hypothetical protein
MNAHGRLSVVKSMKVEQPWFPIGSRKWLTVLQDLPFPGLCELQLSFAHGARTRAAFIGLTYNFGKVTRDPAFDYSG